MQGKKITPYEGCVIYILESKCGRYRYIGGTSDFHKRKIHHKYRCTNPTSLEHEYKVYSKIRQTGGYLEYDFRVLEDNINVMSRKELSIIEKKYIELIRPNLNTYLVK